VTTTAATNIAPQSQSSGSRHAGAAGRRILPEAADRLPIEGKTSVANGYSKDKRGWMGFLMQKIPKNPVNPKNPD
jgi:hypothetical protein